LVQLQHLLLPSPIVTSSQVRVGMPLPLRSCCISGLGPIGLLHNRTILVNLPVSSYLGWPLHLGETLPTRNLPSYALRPKCCLYEMPYYVAAPVRETGDVIMHLQETDFFGSRVTHFSGDLPQSSTGSYVLFFWGSHMREQYHQWTTLRTWNPNSCSKIWRPLGLTLRRMLYGRGMLRIPRLQRFL
jgi:hypothetical protein